MPEEDTLTLSRELTESITELMILLPGWEAMEWRNQANLATALSQIGSAMREVARQHNVDDMRLLYARGEG